MYEYKYLIHVFQSTPFPAKLCREGSQYQVEQMEETAFRLNIHVGRAERVLFSQLFLKGEIRTLWFSSRFIVGGESDRSSNFCS
jgi:hypothetical protein